MYLKSYRKRYHLGIAKSQSTGILIWASQFGLVQSEALDEKRTAQIMSSSSKRFTDHMAAASVFFFFLLPPTTTSQAACCRRPRLAALLRPPRHTALRSTSHTAGLAAIPNHPLAPGLTGFFSGELAPPPPPPP